MITLDERLFDLYKLPGIEQWEDLHLLTLAEQCAVLEDRLYTLAKTLPEKHQQAIAVYIDARNDLEVESIKAALRFRNQCKQTTHL